MALAVAVEFTMLKENVHNDFTPFCSSAPDEISLLNLRNVMSKHKSSFIKYGLLGRGSVHV